MQPLDLKEALAGALGDVSALGRVFPFSCSRAPDGAGNQKMVVLAPGTDEDGSPRGARMRSVLCIPPAPPADASFGPVNCEASWIAMATGAGLEPPEDGKRRHSGGFSRSWTPRHTHSWALGFGRAPRTCLGPRLCPAGILCCWPSGSRSPWSCLVLIEIHLNPRETRKWSFSGRVHL